MRAQALGSVQGWEVKDLPEKVDTTPSLLGPDQLLTPEHALPLTSEAFLPSRDKPCTFTQNLD